MANMPKEITVNVHDDIPDALRDQLVRQLERRAAPIVGNLADLNRLGASTIANSGPDESFRLPPGTDEEEAKDGAKRVLEEEEAAATAAATAGDNPDAGPDEDPAEKDPRERERDGNVSVATPAATATVDTTSADATTETPTTRRSRRGGGE